MRSSCPFVLTLVATGLAFGQAAEAPQRTWSSFNAPDGSFSVNLPGPPAENVTETPVEGATLKTTSYSLNLGPEGFYYVAYTENPGLVGSPPEEAFDGVQKELEKAGILLEQKAMTVGGHPGREISVEMTVKQPGDVLTTARVVVVGDRLYQLLVTSPKATSSPEQQRKFLDSFKVLKTAGA